MADAPASLVLQRCRLQGRDADVTIGVSDGRISAILEADDPGASLGGATRIDVGGRLVLPGFVNAHAHLDKAFLPQTASGSDYRDGLLTGNYDEVKRGYTVEDVQRRARAALDWAIRTGTTAIRTHVDVDPSAGLIPMEAITAVRDEYAGDISIQIVAFAQDGFEADPTVHDMMVKACGMGADLVGGKPSADSDFRRHIDTVVGLASEFGLGVDLHVDTNIELDHAAQVDDEGHPLLLEAAYLAKHPAASGLNGLAASHLCGLDSIPPPLRQRTMQLLADAKVAVISCPSSNLYCMGRSDTYNIRRGIAPVRELLESGAQVAVGTDNFGDAYNLYASPDMMVHVLLTAMACHMRTVEDLETVVELCTTRPAHIMGLEAYGLEVGCWADLMVVEADSLYDAVVGVVGRHLVLKHGRVVHQAAAA